MQVIEVAIGPGSDPGTFSVEVIASPAGEATATVALDMHGLLGGRDRLQQAVLASSVASRRLLHTTEVPVREAGRQLFTALLGTGEVAGVYRASSALASERGQGLRLELRIDDPLLAGLPWEAMYDEAMGEYVCREEPLVRHVSVGRVPPPLTVQPPLRVLGIASSPRGLPRLDVDKEQEQLAHSLARPIAAGLIDLRWAPAATWPVLHEMLLEDQEAWHVVHFIGHGDFDSENDTGVLALEQEEDHRVNLVEARQFVTLLRQAHPMPRLVVLNSCSGAATGQLDLFSGTAAALVRGGVTAVAAMQFEISDPAAIAFTHGFYIAIARNRGVDDAVSSGRTSIIGLGIQTLEWITPVLYLRGKQTQVFEIVTPAATPPIAGSDPIPPTRQPVAEPRERVTPESTASSRAAGASALGAGLAGAGGEAAGAATTGADAATTGSAPAGADPTAVLAAHRAPAPDAARELAPAADAATEPATADTGGASADTTTAPVTEPLPQSPDPAGPVGSGASTTPPDTVLIPTGPGPSRSNQFAGWLVALVLVLLGGGLAWWFSQRSTDLDNGSVTPPVTTSTGQATTTTEPPPVVSHQLRVLGNQAWTDARVACEPGNRYELNASGTVVHNVRTGERAGPNGDPNPGLHKYNLPGLPNANHSALTASLDAKPPFTVVGGSAFYQCQAAGQLFFGPNDVGVDSNSGEWAVTLTPSR